MTGHWDILGIAPTADERVLKKAYARQLKTIDQDLEPERFIALRQAFEWARWEIQEGQQEWDEDQDEAALPVMADALTPPVQDTADVVVEAAPSKPSVDETHEDRPQVTVWLQEEPFTAPFTAQPVDELPVAEPLVEESELWTPAPTQKLPVPESFTPPPAYEPPAYELPEYELPASDALDPVVTDRSADHDQSPPLKPVEAAGPQFEQQLWELRNRLWQKDLGDDTYAQYVWVLDKLPDQVLKLQMSTHDQLIYALAPLVDDHEGRAHDLERFAVYWLRVLGPLLPDVHAHAAFYRWYQRLDTLRKQMAFWDQMPKPYLRPLRQLQQGQGCHYWSMLLLSFTRKPFLQSFREYEWESFPELKKHQNWNLQLLRRLDMRWERLLFIGFTAWFFFILNDGYDVSLVPGDVFRLGACAVLWVYLVQTPVAAWLFSRRTYVVIDYLAVLWLSSGVGLSWIWSRMEAPHREVVASLWGCLGLIIIDCVQYYSRDSLFNWLRSLRRIQADRFYILIGYFAALAITGFVLSSTLVDERYDNQSELLQGIYLLPLPWVLVTYPRYFMDLSTRVISEWWALAFLVTLVVLSVLGSHLIDRNVSAQMVGTVMLMICCGLGLSISTRRLAYGIKYLGYIGTFLGGLSTGIVAIITATYAYYTIKADLAANRKSS